MVLFALSILLTSCAQKKDLVLEIGKGDSIRLVGGADLFYCDDPAYANFNIVRTVTMRFADGSARHLCTKEGTKSLPREPVGPAVTAATPNSDTRFKFDPNVVLPGAR